MKLLLGLILLASFAQAENSLMLNDGRVFAQLKGANATAAYGAFKNDTVKEMTLTVTHAQGFKAVELHRSFEKNGQMQMKKIDQIKIAAGEVFELKPGGNHIMLFDAEVLPKPDESVQIGFLVNGKKEIYAFKVIPRFPVEAVKKPQHGHHH